MTYKMKKIFVLKFNLPKTKFKYTKNCNWKDTVRCISWLIWPQNQFSWWQTLSLGFKKKIFVLPKNFIDISNTITSDLVRQDSSLTVRRIYTTLIFCGCELEILVKQNICKINKTQNHKNVFIRDKSLSSCIESSGQLQAYFLFYFRAVYCYWPDNGRHSINSCIGQHAAHACRKSVQES